MVRKNFTLIVFLIIVLGIAFAWLCKGDNAKPTGKVIDSVFYWKNKYDAQVASLRAAEEDFEVKEKGWVDSIAKVNKSKTKFIREAVTFTQTTDADIAPSGAVEKDYEPAKIPDCPAVIKNMRQTFSNKFYTVNVQIGDSSYLHLKAQDRVTVLWKRVQTGGLFNRKNYLQLDVSNDNPYVTVSGLKSYRIADKKPKKWAIGLQAGYGFSTGMKPSAYVGIGITKSIIRF